MYSLTRLHAVCNLPWAVLKLSVTLQDLVMFYLLQREKELNLHPRFFGPKLHDTLTAQLRAEASSFLLLFIQE